MTDPEVGQLLDRAISKLAPTRKEQAGILGFKHVRQINRLIRNPPTALVRLHRVGIVVIQDPPVGAQQ